MRSHVEDTEGTRTPRRPSLGGLMVGNRRGIFLPTVAGLVTLVLLSVLLVARFGSDSRHLARRNQGRSLCRMAAASALCELQRALEARLSGPSAEWDDFWRQFVPPYGNAFEPELAGATLPVTDAAFARHQVVVDEVEVRCLYRTTGRRIKAQGVFSLSVRARWLGNRAVAVRSLRLLRYYVDCEVLERRPDPDDPTITRPVLTHRLLFFPLCSQERGAPS